MKQMMKKYMTPSLSVVEINTQTVLAGSPGFIDGQSIEGDARERSTDFDWK